MLSRERWRRLVQRNEPNPNIHLFFDVARQPQSPRNTLQLARGDGTYAEVAQLAGVEAAEWGWASIFLDVDLDGYEDLLVANGFERDYMNMDVNRRVTALRAGRQMPPSEQLRLNRLYPRLDTANLAFRNLGNLRFEEVSAEACVLREEDARRSKMAIYRSTTVSGGEYGSGWNPRRLSRDDVRIALFFLFFVQVGFFGTGK